MALQSATPKLSTIEVLNNDHLIARLEGWTWIQIFKINADFTVTPGITTPLKPTFSKFISPTSTNILVVTTNRIATLLEKATGSPAVPPLSIQGSIRQVVVDSRTTPALVYVLLTNEIQKYEIDNQIP